MGLLDRLRPQVAKDKFAQDVIARLTDRGWPHTIAYHPAGFLLELGGGVGEVRLAARFEHWRSLRSAEKSAAFNDLIALIHELGSLPTWEEAKAMLRPTLRPRAAVDAMLAGPPNEVTAKFEGSWRTFGDHLVIHLVIDRPQSRVMVEGPTLSAWGHSFDDAFEIALANLSALPPPKFGRHDGGFYLAPSQDHVSDRMLTPEVFAKLELKGDPVAVAATTRHLLVAGSEDVEALQTMGRAASTIVEEEGRGLAYAPMVLREGVWSPFVAPAGLWDLRALTQQQQAFDYEQQAPLLQHRLMEAGRPDAISPLVVMATSGDPPTLALWAEAECLLPRADVIVLRLSAGKTYARAWADVEAACGGFAREPDTAAPYYVMTGWPDDKALQQIIAAPEPEWAKDKGLGVSNGRLTMFG